MGEVISKSVYRIRVSQYTDTICRNHLTHMVYTDDVGCVGKGLCSKELFFAIGINYLQVIWTRIVPGNQSASWFEDIGARVYNVFDLFTAFFYVEVR